MNSLQTNWLGLVIQPADFWLIIKCSSGNSSHGCLWRWKMIRRRARETTVLYAWKKSVPWMFPLVVSTALEDLSLFLKQTFQARTVVRGTGGPFCHLEGVQMHDFCAMAKCWRFEHLWITVRACVGGGGGGLGKGMLLSETVSTASYITIRDEQRSCQSDMEFTFC